MYSRRSLNAMDPPTYRELSEAWIRVRDDNDVCLGIVGTNYRVLQNPEAFKMGDDLVVNGIATYDACGQFGNGEKVWMLMKRPESFEVVPGDKVNSYIGIVNSHDGNSSLMVFPIPIRELSDVTLNISSIKKSTTVRIKHTESMAHRIKKLGHAVELIDEDFKQLELDCQALLKKTMTQKMVDKFMLGLLDGLNKAKVHPKTTSMYESLIRYYEFGTATTHPGVKGTAWAMMNAVAEWTDFGKATRVMDATSDADTQRAKSLLFDDGREYKQVALDLLLNI